jgi:hypothetical protein
MDNPFSGPATGSGYAARTAAGGQMDLFIAHLTQEAYDAFRLARSGVPASSPMPEQVPTNQTDAAWQPQTEGIRHRLTRLTPSSLAAVLFTKALPGGRELVLVGFNNAMQLVGYRVGLTSDSFAADFRQATLRRGHEHGPRRRCPVRSRSGRALNASP